MADPSWLVATTTGVLAIGETTPSTISAIGLAEGDPRASSAIELSGSLACHAALAATDSGEVSFAVVAHYGSGSVSAVRCEAGRPIAETDHLAFAGSGPDPVRQETSHAHHVLMRDGEAMVCDLGTDRIHRLGLDPRGRLRVVADPIVLPEGTGPRHMVAVGERLVVVGELSVELLVLRRRGLEWVVESSAPSTGRGGAESSALRVDGDGLVWVANRGPDTIAAFALGDRLGRVAEVACGGRWPRDLVVHDGVVWVACQSSDEVVGMDRAAVLRGDFDPVRLRIPSLSPSCIVPLG